MTTVRAEKFADALRAGVTLGVRAFVIQLCDHGEVDTIERFAREVIPRVCATRGHA